jgi:hypothetical protein
VQKNSAATKTEDEGAKCQKESWRLPGESDLKCGYQFTESKIASTSHRHEQGKQTALAANTIQPGGQLKYHQANLSNVSNLAQYKILRYIANAGHVLRSKYYCKVRKHVTVGMQQKHKLTSPGVYRHKIKHAQCVGNLPRCDKALHNTQAATRSTQHVANGNRPHPCKQQGLAIARKNANNTASEQWHQGNQLHSLPKDPFC